jgi:LDH2 family malate/lactate/ureidoglycolate dehydrogenase
VVLTKNEKRKTKNEKRIAIGDHEPEARSRIARLRDGIPVPKEIWADLLKSAPSVGVNPER